MKKSKLFIPLLLLTLIVAACSNQNMQGQDMNNMGNQQDSKETQNESNESHASTDLENETATPVKVLTGKEFTITASEETLKINENTILPVWTFNGSVPGSQIRVEQGDQVKINLKNELPEPVTIHWHGLPVPNSMDGIPGVTMNAVQPGATFTYEFTADTPGTYWYHSHQDSANQVDKGLYGSFVVEGKEDPSYDRDYTLVLDEWMSVTEESVDHGMSNMSGMDHSNMSGDDMMAGHDMSMYDVFTINGKSGSMVEPLVVKEGDRVRIRLINAGFMSHKLDLHGHEYKIISTDGQTINTPTPIKGQLLAIAPGERYDIEFTADNPGEWYLECHGEMSGAKGMKALIKYDGVATSTTDKANDEVVLPVIDITKYGSNAPASLKLDQKYDVEYTMDLNTEMNDMDMVFTINGNTFPDTEAIQAKEGDLVKVKLVNNSPMDDHPMHLHGHFFQVLSKNGVPIEGSPIVKDTLNLKPGEEYVVAFKADNPGNWMFHCHDLHHASAGMVTQVNYSDYTTDFVPDPNAGNKPE